MSFPSEKSPEAFATYTSGTPTTALPPAYDPSHLLPVTDGRPPVYESASDSRTVPTSASTTSLASLDESSAPSPSTPATRLFISQRGNTIRPWPFAYSSDLITPIFDESRTNQLYASTRFKKSSGTCVLTPAYTEQHQEPLNPQDKFEVHTTYAWGPGKDPVISYQVRGEDTKVEIPLKSKSTFSRSRWFVWGGERYEWRYLGRCDSSGLVLQRVVPTSDTCSTPTQEVIITDEKQRPITPTSPCSPSKGKSSRKSEDNYVTIASFNRDPEENKRVLGFGPSGQGGWVYIYETGKTEGGKELPQFMVLASCLVMLKRERDRRAVTIAVMIGGPGGGP